MGGAKVRCYVGCKRDGGAKVRCKVEAVEVQKGWWCKGQVRS